MVIVNNDKPGRSPHFFCDGDGIVSNDNHTPAIAGVVRHSDGPGNQCLAVNHGKLLRTAES
jgi:hypothetical protein